MTIVRDDPLCPVCGSRGNSSHDDTLLRCETCALVWHQRGAADYGGFYDDDSYYEDYFARAAQWRHEARLRLRWLLHRRRQHPIRRLLEVGCGGGFFIQAARHRGIQGVGIEPASAACAYARQHHIGVINASYETVDARNGGVLQREGFDPYFAGMVEGVGYDAICAFHVLEHVPDAAAFVERARLQLRSGGTLALEVPNISSRRARRDGTRWFNLAPDHHVWHFSPGSLARLVEQHGFRVVSLDTAYPRYYLRPQRLATKSGLRALAADVRANPTVRRTHIVHGDYLRLLAVS